MTGPNIKLPPNDFLENINKMYKDEQLTDVILWCPDGSIKAHKVVLAMCSPYFYKVFLENERLPNSAVIMHGVSFPILRDLIELIYKGTVTVAPENVKRLYDLAKELQIRIPEFTEATTSVTPTNTEMENRGQKRAPSDNDDDNDKPMKRSKPPSALQATQSSVEMDVNKTENIEGETTDNNATANSGESPKLSAWAKKQRKFKCTLCPSSFKRSSHLTRHQLVHTGERPFACDQCDKAFSRHDKLKHHIRKTHENVPEVEVEQDYEINLANLPPKSPSPLPFVIAQVETAVDLGGGSSDGGGSNGGGGSGGGGDGGSTSMPAKRGRGRPRKYPIGFLPNSSGKNLGKRGRGRPRNTPSIMGHIENGNHNGENYDITNLPFGDLDYLTMPIMPERVQETDDSMMIEPLVEIKTEKENGTATGEQSLNKTEDEEGSKGDVEEEDEDGDDEDEDEVENGSKDNKVCDSIINKITKIGECTISVANH